MKADVIIDEFALGKGGDNYLDKIGAIITAADRETILRAERCELPVFNVEFPCVFETTPLR